MAISAIIFVYILTNEHALYFFINTIVLFLLLNFSRALSLKNLNCTHTHCLTLILLTTSTVNPEIFVVEIFS